MVLSAVVANITADGENLVSEDVTIIAQILEDIADGVANSSDVRGNT